MCSALYFYSKFKFTICARNWSFSILQTFSVRPGIVEIYYYIRFKSKSKIQNMH